MSFTVSISNRNFTAHTITPFSPTIKKLSWSTVGGCDEALFTAHVPYERLLDYTALLRCPVTVSDRYGEPAWWGYINKITISFQHVKFTISLEDLFNKVKVIYTYLAATNQGADLSETTFGHSPVSQAEYGIKERVLMREHIDGEFALALRNTFLELSSFPRSVPSPSAQVEVSRVEFECKGWIHHLGWRFYQDLEGYYANHGPGPGMVPSGDGTISLIAQNFTPGINCSLKYAWLYLRKRGSPVSNIYCRLLTDSGGNPNASLGQSGNFAGAGLPSYNTFEWVRFTWGSPIAMTAATPYWLVMYPAISDAANHYHVRLDENSNFKQNGMFAKRYSGGAWSAIPALTMSWGRPDLFFRIETVQDSGALLYNLATATSQYFTGIQTLTSGVISSPYRDNGLTTLAEIKILMDLGTVNQRRILANVDINRRLKFYEAPDPSKPLVLMDKDGRYLTQQKILLPPWRPPIGQYALLTDVDRLSPPFDLKRTPAYFVDHATYVAPTTP